MDKLKSIYAAAISTKISIVLVGMMTIWAELSASFKAWLTGFTGHHWTTKSWITLIAFVLFYLLFRYIGGSVEANRLKKVLAWLIAFIVLGFLIILGFY